MSADRCAASDVSDVPDVPDIPDIFFRDGARRAARPRRRTPARIVAMPARAIGVTVSWRNARPRASATIGKMSMLRLTTVASILLIR